MHLLRIGLHIIKFHRFYSVSRPLILLTRLLDLAIVDIPRMVNLTRGDALDLTRRSRTHIVVRRRGQTRISCKHERIILCLFLEEVLCVLILVQDMVTGQNIANSMPYSR